MTGVKFMPELHLKQPGLTYSSCGPFTKHLCRNNLDKVCFAHDPVYSDSKDLA